MRHTGPLVIGQVIARSLVVAGLLACGPLAHAEPRNKNDPNVAALAKAQTLLKQVAGQKAAVEAELAGVRLDSAKKEKEAKKAVDKLQEEVASTRATLDETSTNLDAARQSNAALAGRLKDTEGQLERTEAALKEMTASYEQTDRTLAQTQSEKEDLEAKLAEQTRLTTDAEARNRKLHEAGVELMQRFADKGVMDSLLQAEPFTGIKQVQIENVIEEYSYKIDQLKIDPSRRPATAAAEPPR